MEHIELLRVAQEAGNEAIKRVDRRKIIRKNRNQHRIKHLPHGYYHSPSVREMYQLMKSSVGEYD